MPGLEVSDVVVVAVALVAAIVNGAVGYGFSSITVPVAIQFVPQRALNPALILVEVPMNLVSLWLNRSGVRPAFVRARPVLVGLLPGVIGGAVVVGAAAADTLKLVTFALLLPLIAVQALRLQTVTSSASTATGFGAGLGVLYATTTISGPPLALFWNRQGLAGDEFRAAVAVVRVAESVFALVVYAATGLLTTSAVPLAAMLLPAVAIGLPIGRRLAAHVPRESFRRVVLVLDFVLVATGLGTALVRADASVFVVVAAAAPIAVVAAAGLVALARRARARDIASDDVTATPSTLNLHEARS